MRLVLWPIRLCFRADSRLLSETNEKREFAKSVIPEQFHAAPQLLPAKADPAFWLGTIEPFFARLRIMRQHEIDGEADPAAGMDVGEDRLDIGFPIPNGMTESNIEDPAGERIVG